MRSTKVLMKTDASSYILPPHFPPKKNFIRIKLTKTNFSTTAKSLTSRGSGGGGSLLVSEPVGCPLAELARPPTGGVTFATTNSVKVTSAVPPDSSGMGC